jgi:S-adenosylmethionine decarboxylase
MLRDKLNKVSLGTHILLNISECDGGLLSYVESVRSILDSAIFEAGLTKVGESFHQFEPIGATGVLLLSESHVCIHTWPEFNAAAIDIFCCGSEEKARLVAELLVDKFQATKFQQQVCFR